jgi:hypothetical protein
MKRFLPHLAEQAEWQYVTGDQYQNVNDLLKDHGGKQSRSYRDIPVFR